MTTCVLQTPLSQHLCVTRIRICEVYAQCIYTRKMCVQQVRVCTPTVAHTEVATTWVRTPVSSTLLLEIRNKKLITP